MELVKILEIFLRHFVPCTILKVCDNIMVMFSGTAVILKKFIKTEQLGIKSVQEVWISFDNVRSRSGASVVLEEILGSLFYTI